MARPDNRAILNIIRAFIAPRPLVIRHSTQQRAMAPRRSFTPRGEPRGKQKSEATLRKHRRDTRRWIDRGKKEGWRDECEGVEWQNSSETAIPAEGRTRVSTKERR